MVSVVLCANTHYTILHVLHVYHSGTCFVLSLFTYHLTSMWGNSQIIITCVCTLCKHPHISSHSMVLDGLVVDPISLTCEDISYNRKVSYNANFHDFHGLIQERENRN